MAVIFFFSNLGNDISIYFYISILCIIALVVNTNYVHISYLWLLKCQFKWKQAFF